MPIYNTCLGAPVQKHTHTKYIHRDMSTDCNHAFVSEPIPVDSLSHPSLKSWTTAFAIP